LDKLRATYPRARKVIRDCPQHALERSVSSFPDTEPEEKAPLLICEAKDEPRAGSPGQSLVVF
jgi:hypothetical protein